MRQQISPAYKSTMNAAILKFWEINFFHTKGQGIFGF